MKTKKQIGVWLDNKIAQVMKGGNEQQTTSKNILSDFTRQQKNYYLNKNENVMHNKERHEQAKYYKEIEDAIKGNDEILIFGPTKAKDELANLIKNNPFFESVKIEVKSSDKMTEDEREEFVQRHFNWK